MCAVCDSLAGVPGCTPKRACVCMFGQGRGNKFSQRGVAVMPFTDGTCFAAAAFDADCCPVCCLCCAVCRRHSAGCAVCTPVTPVGLEHGWSTLSCSRRYALTKILFRWICALVCLLHCRCCCMARLCRQPRLATLQALSMAGHGWHAASTRCHPRGERWLCVGQAYLEGILFTRLKV